MSDHQFAKWLKSQGLNALDFEQQGNFNLYKNKAGKLLAYVEFDNSACTRKITIL